MGQWETACFAPGMCTYPHPGLCLAAYLSHSFRVNLMFNMPKGWPWASLLTRCRVLASLASNTTPIRISQWWVQLTYSLPFISTTSKTVCLNHKYRLFSCHYSLTNTVEQLFIQRLHWSIFSDLRKVKLSRRYVQVLCKHQSIWQKGLEHRRTHFEEPTEVLKEISHVYRGAIMLIFFLILCSSQLILNTNVTEEVTNQNHWKFNNLISKQSTNLL